MKYLVSFDASRCSGCWACTMTCADEHDLSLGEGDRPYCLVRLVETGLPGIGCVTAQRTGCLHCEDAVCMARCPAGCFSRADNGIVVLDPANCLGCGVCVRSCPNGAVSINRRGVAAKCDGCIARVQAGMRPACEQICPTGALQFSFADLHGSGNNKTRDI